MSLNTPRTLSFLVALTLAGGLALACGPKPSPYTPQTSGSCSGPTCGGQGSGGSTANPPPPTTGGASGGGVLAPARSQATPLDPVAAGAAAQVLSPLATPYVGNATPVSGASVAGQFLEGQALDLRMNLEPGKCYTVVAAGLPEVREVDIELTQAVIEGVPSPVIAADNSTGQTAVLAPAPNCWKATGPLALPAKISLIVSKGQGVAALQVYAR